MKMITHQPKIYGTQRNSPKREMQNNTGLHQETEKIPNKQFNFTSTGLEKEQQAIPKVLIRKKIIKIRMEINKIESKNLKNNTKYQ